MQGPKALIKLSKEAAAQLENDDEQAEEVSKAQLQALREHRESCEKPFRWVKEGQVQADIQHTYENVNREVSGSTYIMFNKCKTLNMLTVPL